MAAIPVTVVSLPAEDGPRNEARPQAGLEESGGSCNEPERAAVSDRRIDRPLLPERLPCGRTVSGRCLARVARLMSAARLVLRRHAAQTQRPADYRMPAASADMWWPMR